MIFQRQTTIISLFSVDLTVKTKSAKRKARKKKKHEAANYNEIPILHLFTQLTTINRDPESRASAISPPQDETSKMSHFASLRKKTRPPGDLHCVAFAGLEKTGKNRTATNGRIMGSDGAKKIATGGKGGKIPAEFGAGTIFSHLVRGRAYHYRDR